MCSILISFERVGRYFDIIVEFVKFDVLRLYECHVKSHVGHLTTVIVVM
jgi:hypothetical protein